MINIKRLNRIEAALTPTEAVLHWLREFRQRTFPEYARWLMVRPLDRLPRIRVVRQVANSVRAAMKGQEKLRIARAVQCAEMNTDLLILLVLRLNSMVREESRCGWLQIAFLLEQLYSGSSSSESESHGWASAFAEAVMRIFSMALAIERIQARYFAEESVLAKDVKDGLEVPIILLRHLLSGVAEEVRNDGHPELAIDSCEFRTMVNRRASEKVLYVEALAKSEMLHYFGFYDAAEAALKPYVLGRS